jgi:hypothetical protein
VPCVGAPARSTEAANARTSQPASMHGRARAHARSMSASASVLRTGCEGSHASRALLAHPVVATPQRRPPVGCGLDVSGVLRPTTRAFPCCPPKTRCCRRTDLGLVARGREELVRRAPRPDPMRLVELRRLADRHDMQGQDAAHRGPAWQLSLALVPLAPRHQGARTFPPLRRSAQTSAIAPPRGYATGGTLCNITPFQHAT